VNSYFVSKAAAQSGLKAAISGLGGDELLGGYPSFRQIPAMVRALRLFPAALQRGGKGLRTLLAPILKRVTSPKYASLLEYGASYGGSYLLRRGLFMPWEIPGAMDAATARDALEKLATIPQLNALAGRVRKPNLKVTLLEASWFMRSQLLRDIDWASMAHSLEVRVPLLDVQLLKTLAPLLSAENPVGKRDLARTPRVPLPPEVLRRRKTGFSVPVRDWLVEKMPGKAAARGVRGWALAVIDNPSRSTITVHR
jgi:asparagine synthase (glutamine-hydrolysing)